MYKEFRTKASTPEVWTSNFVGDRSFTLSKLNRSLFSLNRRLFDPRWREIAAATHSGQEILDAGCGMGQWVQFLNAQGYVAAGLDYSDPMIGLLKQAYPATAWHEGEIQAIPLPPASMDAVISWGVIEHDEAGPEAALKEFHRILRPGGKLFVTVPIDSAATRRLSLITEGPPDRDTATFYQYFFTPEELAEHVAAAGFTVDRAFPCTRHYMVAAPGVYRRLRGSRHVVEAMLALLLRPWLAMHKDSYLMTMAVATRHG
ncbi:MAG: class I SAM-dependent methyltransferase [Armatimonadetes bacterium]|nr:class I SAM-dependent methyltransferase [Armatimonadota bacterium]MDE2206779.1 class I SAM-dependent methyltransferase [Armatimonadota bacterium]